MAKMSIDEKSKGRGRRVCKNCGNARGLIRKYSIQLCRRCFREIAESIGFRKFGE